MKEDAEADEVLVLLPEGYVLPKKQKALLEISEVLGLPTTPFSVSGKPYSD